MVVLMICLKGESTKKWTLCTTSGQIQPWEERELTV